MESFYFVNIESGKMKTLLFTLFSAILLSACGNEFGDEVARLPIKELSNEELKFQEVSLELKKGDELSFWTDLDIEFDVELELGYGVEIYRGETMLDVLQLDVFAVNPILNETTVTIGKNTKRSYMGKMESLLIEEDDTYVFKAVLISSEFPPLNIAKADLVIKQ